MAPMEIDVALGPAEIALLPDRDWTGTGAIVFDVLRATSSILTGLAADARTILPVETIEEAHAAKRRHPDALLCGERGGDRIEGFDLGNSPSEYTRTRGRTLITTTTNGTVALRRCAAAERVFVGALLNLDALLEALRESGLGAWVLVCAGTHETVALEDVIAAGAVCDAFPEAKLTDAALIARTAWREARGDLLGALRSSRNGRACLAAGRDHDLAGCAALSSLAVVGELGPDGRIVCLRKTGEPK
jgi:2-phosphosulfolactate phosphatase